MASQHHGKEIPQQAEQSQQSAAQQHAGTVLVDQPTESGTRVTLTLRIRPGSSDYVRSPILKVDYAGERDHGLLELSDVLPADLYKPQ